jgi:hypothetical protein
MLRGLVLILVLATTARSVAAETTFPSVMDRRWAVAVLFGAETMQAQADDPDRYSFGVGEFAARFRLLPELEFALTLSGAGTYDVKRVGVYADVRYRLMAEQPWNPAGIGVSGAFKSSANGADEARLSARIGAGIERRFKSWAFASELHLLGVGPNSSVTERSLAMQDYLLGRNTVIAVSLTLGATYYFGSGSRVSN